MGSRVGPGSREKKEKPLFRTRSQFIVGVSDSFDGKNRRLSWVALSQCLHVCLE